MTPEREAFLKWEGFQGAEEALSPEEKALAAKHAFLVGGNNIEQVPPTLRRFVAQNPKVSAPKADTSPIPAPALETTSPRTSDQSSVNPAPPPPRGLGGGFAAPVPEKPAFNASYQEGLPESPFAQAVRERKAADEARFSSAEVEDPATAVPQRAGLSGIVQPSYAAGTRGGTGSMSHIAAVTKEGEKDSALIEAPLQGLNVVPKAMYPAFATPFRMGEGEVPLERLVLPAVQLRNGEVAFDMMKAHQRLSSSELVRILRDDYNVVDIRAASPQIISDAKDRAKKFADETLSEFQFANPSLAVLQQPEGAGAVSSAVGEVLGETAKRAIAPIEETLFRQDRGWFDPNAQIWRGGNRDISARTPGAVAWDVLDRVGQMAPSTPVMSWAFSNVEWGSPEHLQLIRNGYDAFDDVGPITALLAETLKPGTNANIEPGKGDGFEAFMLQRMQGKGGWEAFNEATGGQYEAFPGWTELGTADKLIGSPAFIASVFLEPDVLFGVAQGMSMGGKAAGATSGYFTGRAANAEAFDSAARVLTTVAGTVDNTPESIAGAVALLRSNPRTSGIADQLVVEAAAELALPADQLTSLGKAIRRVKEHEAKILENAPIIADLNKSIDELNARMGDAAKDVTRTVEERKAAEEALEQQEMALEALRAGLKDVLEAQGIKGADVEWASSAKNVSSVFADAEKAVERYKELRKGREDLFNQVAARDAARRLMDDAQTELTALEATKPSTKLVWADDLNEMSARIESMAVGSGPTAAKFKAAVHKAAADVVDITDVRARRLAFANKMRAIEKAFEPERLAGWKSPLSVAAEHVEKIKGAKAKLASRVEEFNKLDAVIKSNPEAVKVTREVAALQDKIKLARSRLSSGGQAAAAFRAQLGRVVKAKQTVEAAKAAAKAAAAAVKSADADNLKKLLDRKDELIKRLEKLRGEMDKGQRVGATFQAVLHRYANSASRAAKNLTESGDAFAPAASKAAEAVPSITRIGVQRADGSVEMAEAAFTDYLKQIEAFYKSSELAPIWKAADAVDATGNTRVFSPAQVRELQQAEEAAAKFARIEAMSAQELLQAKILADAWQRSDLFFSRNWGRTLGNMLKKLVDSFDPRASKFGRVAPVVAEQVEATINLTMRAKDEVHDLWKLAGEPEDRLLRIDKYLSSTESMPFRGETSTIGNRGYSATNVAPRSFFEDAQRLLVGGPRLVLPVEFEKLDEAIKNLKAGEQLSPELLKLQEQKAALIKADKERRAGLSAGDETGTREKILRELTTVWIGAGRVLDPKQQKVVYNSVLKALETSNSYAAFMEQVKKTTGLFTSTEDFQRAYLIGAQTMIHAGEVQRLAYRTRKAVGLRDTAKLVNALNDARLGLTKNLDSLESLIRAHVAYGLPVNVQSYRATPGSPELMNLLQKIGTDEDGAAVYMPSQVISYLDGYLTSVTKTMARVPAEDLSGSLVGRAAMTYSTFYRTSLTVGYGVVNMANISNNAFSDAIQGWQVAGLTTGAKIAAQSFTDNFPVVGRMMRSVMAKMSEKAAGKPILSPIMNAVFDPMVDAIWTGKEGMVRLGDGRVASYADLQRWAVEDGVMEAYIPEGLNELIVRSYDYAKGGIGRRDALAMDAITTFSNTVQARRRLMLYVDRLQKGMGRAKAKKDVLDAYYDWTHGLSAFESKFLVHAGMFYRFTSLSTRQMMRTLTEPMAWSSQGMSVGQQYMRAAATSRIARTRDIMALQSNAQDFFTDYPQQGEMLDDMEQLQAYTDYFHAPWWSTGRGQPFPSKVLNDSQRENWLVRGGAGGTDQPGVADRLIVQGMLPSDAITDRFVWSMMLAQFMVGAVAKGGEFLTGKKIVPSGYMDDRSGVFVDWMNPVAKTAASTVLGGLAMSLGEQAHFGMHKQGDGTLLADLTANEAALLRSVDQYIAQPAWNAMDPGRSRLAQYRPPIFQGDGVPVLYTRNPETGKMATNAAWLAFYRAIPSVGNTWVNQLGPLVANPYEGFTSDWMKFAFGGQFGYKQVVMDPTKIRESDVKSRGMELQEIVDATIEHSSPNR